jgi:hypothetical protein
VKLKDTLKVGYEVATTLSVDPKFNCGHEYHAPQSFGKKRPLLSNDSFFA